MPDATPKVETSLRAAATNKVEKARRPCLNRVWNNTTGPKGRSIAFPLAFPVLPGVPISLAALPSPFMVSLRMALEDDTSHEKRDERSSGLSVNQGLPCRARARTDACLADGVKGQFHMSDSNQRSSHDRGLKGTRTFACLDCSLSIQATDAKRAEVLQPRGAGRGLFLFRLWHTPLVSFWSQERQADAPKRRDPSLSRSLTAVLSHRPRLGA